MSRVNKHGIFNKKLIMLLDFLWIFSPTALTTLSQRLAVSLSNTAKGFSKSVSCLAVHNELEVVEDIRLDAIENGIMYRRWSKVKMVVRNK